jgi:hypothetical protein
VSHSTVSPQAAANPASWRRHWWTRQKLMADHGVVCSMILSCRTRFAGSRIAEIDA